MEGVPTDLWEAAKVAGPFGTLLMMFLWWRADAERLRLQKEQKEEKEADKARNDALLERVITGLHNATEAVRGLKEILQAGSSSGRSRQ